MRRLGMKGSRTIVLAAAFAAAGAAVACAPDPVVDRRAIVMHVPSACAPADANAAYALFQAFGDFQPSPDAPAADAKFARDIGADLLALPADARAVAVDLSQADARWRGVATVASEGDVDVLLSPVGASCALSANAGPRVDGAIAAIDARHALVTGGHAPASGPVPFSAVIDLATGAIARPTGADLLKSRDRATATATTSSAQIAGDRVVVVAGGADREGRPLASAERFVLDAGFDASTIELSDARVDHGAVRIASGEVLLVGGRGATGAPLASLEAVDATARRSRSAGLASLAVPRARPNVMRTASGEILVAGGEDASGAPVPTLEWLSADASLVLAQRTRDLVATRERSFVPLAGGGALAVVVPDAPDPSFGNVWVISADGAIDRATPIPGTLTRARLFAATDGAPVLWTGDRWLRWQPWAGAFAPLVEAQVARGPSDDALLHVPDDVDRGAASWLAPDGTFATLRFSTRTAWSAETRTLLHDDPIGTVPDRLVIPGTTRALRFDAAAGGLILEEGASVFVPDTSYASFTLDLDAARPPAIVLRDASTGASVELGGSTCAYAGDVPAHLRLTREGASLTVTTDRDATCVLPFDAGARLFVGLRGRAGTSIARDWTIRRRR